MGRSTAVSFKKTAPLSVQYEREMKMGKQCLLNILNQLLEYGMLKGYIRTLTYIGHRIGQASN